MAGSRSKSHYFIGIDEETGSPRAMRFFQPTSPKNSSREQKESEIIEKLNDERVTRESHERAMEYIRAQNQEYERSGRDQTMPTRFGFCG